jgi:hypothetical protein
MQTLDEARQRAAAEQGLRKASLAQDRQDLEVRSRVLSIRESELTSRVSASERRLNEIRLGVAPTSPQAASHRSGEEAHRDHATQTALMTRGIESL